MIHSDQASKPNQGLKKPFRRTGPLDAYIYEKRTDETHIEDIKKDVFISFKPKNILPQETIHTHLPEIRKESIMHVFTDGACPNNGKRNANAAWAALLVTDGEYVILDRKSGSIPILEPQTNQRAELTALLRGLEIAENKLLADPTLKKIQIWSDSQYSINCASVWGPTWKSRGWKKQGGEIQHLDLIRVLVEKTQSLGFKIEYKWLKGHKGGQSQHVFPWKFNHMVDELANSALR
jgi:ribonuclease HI